MVLSKFLSYVAVAIIMFAIGTDFQKRYPNVFSKKEDKEKFDETSDIIEFFCTRQPLHEQQSRLTKGIEFDPNHYDHARDIIKHLISSAQKTIHLAMYILTDKHVCDALKEAHRRGVKIFIIIDYSMKNSSSSMIKELSDTGAQLRISKSTMHHKLCLIDVPYDESLKKLQVPLETPVKLLKDSYNKAIIPKCGLVITGSMNWTDPGLSSNHENYIVTSNKNVCEQSACEFFEIWKQLQ